MAWTKQQSGIYGTWDKSNHRLLLHKYQYQITGISNGVLRRQPDISLAKEILDGTPTIQREEGLKSTIPYFEKQLKISRRI